MPEYPTLYWPTHPESFVSSYFKRKDFECKCGCGQFNPHPLLVLGLDMFRVRAGKSTHLISGGRCAAHNASVRGEEGSLHLVNMAADIAVIGMSPERMAELAEQIWMFHDGGIGLYNNSIHVDVGSRRRWDRRTKPKKV